jgi:predicted nucleic acid-binding protein
MYVLCDANLLLRAVQATHAQYAEATQALASLRSNGHEPVIVPQVVYEFWVVATRPTSQNGLGFSAARAASEVDAIQALYPIFEDETGLIGIWRMLVSQHAVVGKRAHDARLVAAMIRHGLSHLLTFNVRDFSRFAEIKTVRPTDASALLPNP